MESITIYGVGKYKDDVSTINRAEAALLLIELYKALYTDISITSIIMPICITKTE